MSNATQRLQLRASEWMLLAYFAYAALLASRLSDRPNLEHQPLSILAAVSAGLVVLAWMERYFTKAISYFRDFLPLGLTLLAFEEMTFFRPSHYDGHLERVWVHWDHMLLQNWHLHAAIELFGNVIPVYLEWCYLLVYGVGTYCVIVLYLEHRRAQVDRFFLVLLAGTLGAYALFPFFPSQPPRLAFPGLDGPSVTNWVRRFNVWILRSASIQTSVFPSAHVSSAFAAAWAMFLLMPDKKRFGWGVLVYAVSVSIATIYGRYHYAADVLAGFAISLAAAALCLWLRFARRRAD